MAPNRRFTRRSGDVPGHRTQISDALIRASPKVQTKSRWTFSGNGFPRLPGRIKSEDPIMRSALERSVASGRSARATRVERPTCTPQSSPTRPRRTSLFRATLVRRIRKEIEAGAYETRARIDRTADLLLRRLLANGR